MHSGKRACLLARCLHPRGELQEARLPHTAHKRQARRRLRAALSELRFRAGVCRVQALHAGVAASSAVKQHVGAASGVAALHEVGAVLRMAEQVYY